MGAQVSRRATREAAEARRVIAQANLDNDMKRAVNDGNNQRVIRLFNRHDEGITPNANLTNHRGVSLLMTATRHGDLEIVKTLLDHRADINHQGGPSNDSALMIASHWGRLDTVMELVNRGADKELENHIGWTALMFASSGQHENTVAFLISAGAIIHNRNDGGQTATGLATRENEVVGIRRAVRVLAHAEFSQKERFEKEVQQKRDAEEQRKERTEREARAKREREEPKHIRA